MPVCLVRPTSLSVLDTPLTMTMTNENSDLRMLKALVDEHRDGPRGGAFRLKEAFVNDPKRVEQLLDTFPMSSVLKKVRVALPVLL